MSHLTPLELSMVADAATDGNAFASHLERCPDCRGRLEAWRAEARLLQSLAVDSEAVTPDVPELPKFRKPMTLTGFAIANLATGALVWFASFLWKTLFGELLVELADQAASLFVPDAYALFANTLLFLTREGLVVINDYLAFIVLAVVAVGVFWLVASMRHRGHVVAACLILGVVGLAPGASALERRGGEEANVRVDAAETIDDTVVLTGDTVIVEGRITGDALVAAKRIVIKGEILGNLVAFAENVSIEGTVGGFVGTAGSDVSLEGAEVGGDLWAAGSSVTIDDGARVGRNATIATKLAVVSGMVSRDLTTFAESLELRGTVGEDVEAYGSGVALLDGSDIAGDLRIRSKSEDALNRSSGANVDGAVEFPELPESFREDEDLGPLGTVIGQLLYLASAFLFGYVLYNLFPGLRGLAIGDAAGSLRTGAIGFGSLVATPVACIIAAVTIVGLPFALFGVFAWLALLFIAKIVLAEIIGGMLLEALDRDEGLVRTLLLGLVVIVVVTNLPFIGGILSFVFTVLGLGLVVQWLMDSFADRDADYV